jgi:hypothetical protein
MMASLVGLYHGKAKAQVILSSSEDTRILSSFEELMPAVNKSNMTNGQEKPYSVIMISVHAT